MAQLIVRNLDEDLVRELKLRAARHGRSAEAEHRAILEGELRRASSGMTLKELLCSMPAVGDDEDFSRIGGDFRLDDP